MASLMVYELRGAGQSFQSNAKSHSEGISHTMCLAAHVCPSALRCCFFHICGSIQNHCGLHPMFDSTALCTCLPTMIPPASHRDCSYQNVHPICLPILSIHHPHTALPTCPCISRCCLVHHTFHPTCNMYNICLLYKHNR